MVNIDPLEFKKLLGERLKHDCLCYANALPMCAGRLTLLGTSWLFCFRPLGALQTSGWQNNYCQGHFFSFCTIYIEELTLPSSELNCPSTLPHFCSFILLLKFSGFGNCFYFHALCCLYNLHNNISSFLSNSSICWVWGWPKKDNFFFHCQNINIPHAYEQPIIKHFFSSLDHVIVIRRQCSVFKHIYLPSYHPFPVPIFLLYWLTKSYDFLQIFQSCWQS